MRWGNGNFKFSRPIRWIVSLCDSKVLPIKIENGDTIIDSNSFSYGHRILKPGPINIPHAASYLDILRSAYVEVDPIKRHNTIENNIKTIAKNLKGAIILEISNGSPLMGILGVSDIIIEVQKKPIVNSVNLEKIVEDLIKQETQTLLLTVINKSNQRRYLGIKLK